MNSTVSKWLLASAAVCVAGCGYVGEPLPPALNIPMPVRDLAVQEVGDKLVVTYTQPDLTTEGLPVKKLEKPDLRINGQAVDVPAEAKPVVRYELPVGQWVGQSIVVAVRSVSGKRNSALSNQVDFKVVAPLATPGDLQAAGDPKGVRLTWVPEAGRSGLIYKVLRRTPDQPAAGEVGTADKGEYIDATAVYGQAYEYSVLGSLEAAVSETAGPVAVKPVDVFPPSVPAGLSANASVGRIGLTWDRVTEPDLRGYRIYRGLKGEALSVFIDMVDTPAYSDRQVEAGKTYVYAISSLDQAGNESARSQPLEVTAP
jgi:hypothetical protein